MDTKQLLKLLVETESPSHDKSAVDRVGALVAEEARKLGAQVEIIPNPETGDHIIARFQPSSSSLPPIRVAPLPHGYSLPSRHDPQDAFP